MTAIYLKLLPTICNSYTC